MLKTKLQHGAAIFHEVEPTTYLVLALAVVAMAAQLALVVLWFVSL